jgi:ribonuclease T1
VSILGRQSGWRFPGKLGFAIGLAVLFAFSDAVPAKELKTAYASVSLANLPIEAQETEHLIRAGGPFPYAKDGVVFGNREHLLPVERRGYYREYTVKTPGSRDRRARRIVCGGRQITAPNACFYTDDHYASFRLIVK